MSCTITANEGAVGGPWQLLARMVLVKPWEEPRPALLHGSVGSFLPPPAAAALVGCDPLLPATVTK